MKIVIFIMLILLVSLFTIKWIYIRRIKKLNAQKLKELQMSLWGYIGEPDNKKRKELYEKYLDVYGSQMDSRI